MPCNVQILENKKVLGTPVLIGVIYGTRNDLSLCQLWFRKLVIKNGLYLFVRLLQKLAFETYLFSTLQNVKKINGFVYIYIQIYSVFRHQILKIWKMIISPARLIQSKNSKCWGCKYCKINVKRWQKPSIFICYNIYHSYLGLTINIFLN